MSTFTVQSPHRLDSLTMLLTNFFCLLLLMSVDGDSPEGECSYQEVLKYLNLTKSNELFYMTRPVRDFRKPTEVSLEVLLYAILDVREIDQTFIPYVWIILEWQNDYISWNPSDFCGIQNVTIPTDSLWKPDLTIEEMTEKDKAPPSPHLIINSSGKVIIQNDQVLVSTCRMQIHKFPFDIQTCNLSIKSVVHSVEEIKLFHRLNSSVITNSSRQLMRTQYEWLFVNMTVTSKTVFPFGVEQDVIIYTISMKRRPTLYIVNFLLPILFFLFLDMSSFLISDRGGEKLSFKVTVLLAVTVMQLILNDILPSSSEWIPLIMVYCIGIFSLMMLSLLETILMMYLMERESASQDDELERNQGGGEGGEENQGRKGSLHSCEEVKNRTACRWVCGAPAKKMPAEPLQGSGSQLIEEPHSSEMFSGELNDLIKTMNVLLSGIQEERKTSYWTRKIKTINKVYFVFYVTAASLFLCFMFYSWLSTD
ncbi:5-hydroxytryptamine receptor 3A [Nothobranchius furzeri]|uniref:5-hydroxytryptamine receptor 3A n=1 Tax=Nothobranchius furzeri TaxID=105023 RepID=UPI003904BB60